MMQMTIRFIATAIAACLCTQTAAAHHSNTAFDVEKIIEIKGVVKDFQWSNPHTWIHMMVDDGKGGQVEWHVENRPPSILLRSGWSKDSVRPGDALTIHCSPMKDGSHYCLAARVTLADGSILATNPQPQK